MKKDRSVIKLVLSIVSLMIGVIWAGATIIVLGSRGTDVPLWRFIVLIAFTILFFFLGVRGLLRWNRARREGGKKIGKAVPILLGVVAVLLVSQMALVFPFVFYHNGSFSIPSSSFTRGTDDPDKVNVVVAYTDSTSRNGVWVDEVTGKEVSDTLVQHVTLSLIRLEDWALIDEVSFSQQLKQGENGVNVLGMNQVQFYLNELGQ